MSIEMDLRDVEKAFRSLEYRLSRQGAVFESLKKPAKADQRQHRGRDMDGGSWRGRAPSTVKRYAEYSAQGKPRKKGAPKRKPRQLLGRLVTGVSTKADSGGLALISKIPWSGVHMDGGTVGHGAHLPARPFLYFSIGFLRLAEKKFVDLVREAFGGGYE